MIVPYESLEPPALKATVEPAVTGLADAVKVTAGTASIVIVVEALLLTPRSSVTVRVTV